MLLGKLVTLLLPSSSQIVSLVRIGLSSSRVITSQRRLISGHPRQKICQSAILLLHATTCQLVWLAWFGLAAPRRQAEWYLEGGKTTPLVLCSLSFPHAVSQRNGGTQTCPG